MVRHLNPAGMMPPFSVNTHGIEVGPDHRVLFTSGQVGQAENGEIPAGIAAQTELAWSNLEKVLNAAGMGLEHLVHVNSYLTRREDLDAFFKTREPRMLRGRPTATLVIVSGLAHPEWLVEIEGYAAAPLKK
ncbi:MAG: RidA family protein [Gammaproteobacteria bacterium]|nr:RidA family protein [Gammaproteobacteria bacterium]